LPAGDAKTVLVLSDSSGGSGLTEDAGYLTGYPLREFGYFALARTWSAPEMSRPGCVWTHTLFVDFADLANLGSIEALLASFRRPAAKTPFSEYAEPLIIERGLVPKAIEIAQEKSNWCRQLLTALYEYPKDKIIASPPPFDPEPLILAVWTQQWPRLRRSFCFCTSTAMDRSVGQLQFDFQLLTTRDRGAASRFPQSRNLTECEPTSAPWMDDIISDMFNTRNSSLRSFLHRVGGEVQTGRAAFLTLVKFRRLLIDADSQPAAVDEAITAALTYFSNNLIVSQFMLVKKAAKHAGHLSKDSHDFLLQHLSELDSETLQSEAEKIGVATWIISPMRFCELLEGSKNEVTIGTLTLFILSSEQLIEGLHKQPDVNVVAQILSYRPDLTAVPSFWEAEPLDEPALAFLSKNQNRCAQAIAAMIECGERRLARKAFVSLGSQNVWKALAPAMDRALESELYELQPWLDASLVDLCGIAEVLAEGQFHTKKSLAMIVRSTQPDSIPNDYGDDPWMLAMQAARGNLTQSDEVYLMSYLLARALGGRSRNPAGLAVLTLDCVYFEAARNSIQSDAWYLLDSRLPHPKFWASWDRCERLRYAMSNMFIEMDLAPRVFANLTSDDNVFTELVRTAKFTKRGRQYLKLVKKALREENESNNASRISTIDIELD
jgi:hypothetical protein